MSYHSVIKAFNAHPYIAFPVAVLFAALFIWSRKTGRLFWIRHIWLIVASVHWAAFGVYKMLTSGDAFLLLMDAWFVIPTLFVNTSNALIWFVWDLVFPPEAFEERHRTQHRPPFH